MHPFRSLLGRHCLLCPFKWPHVQALNSSLEKHSVQCAALPCIRCNAWAHLAVYGAVPDWSIRTTLSGSCSLSPASVGACMQFLQRGWRTNHEARRLPRGAAMSTPAKVQGGLGSHQLVEQDSVQYDYPALEELDPSLGVHGQQQPLATCMPAAAACGPNPAC
jgi:hypothetical protein